MPAETLIHTRVAAAQAGENPTVLARMASGWAVLADKQTLRGWSILLPDPVVADLNALEGPGRARFLTDMARLGDAVRAATGAVRINYEMLGNLEPALHAHVIPRYADEPAEMRTKPVWFYDADAAPDFDPERDQPLMRAIAEALSTA